MFRELPRCQGSATQGALSYPVPVPATKMPGFCYPGTATGTGTDTRVFFYCSLSFVNRIRRGAVTRGADAEPREQSHGHGEGLRVARWGPGSHDGLPIGRNEKRERRQRREERKPGGDGLSSCRQEPETTSTRPPSSEAPLTADVRSLNSHEVPVVEMQPNSLKPDGIDPTRHQELAATEKTAEQDDRDGLVCREALDSCESSQDSQGRGPSTAAAQRSLEGPHQPNSNEPRPTTELYDPAIGQDHRATLSSSKILPAGKLLPVSLWTDTAAEGAATLLPFQATSVAVLPSDSHEPEPLAEVFEPQARQDHAAELRPVDPGALAQEDFVSTPTSPEVLVAGLLAGSHRPEPIVLPELLKPPTEQMVGDSLVSQEAQAAAMRQASQEPEPGAQDPTVMAATFHRVLDGVGVAARGPVPYMPEHTVVTRGQKTKQEVAASMSPNERPVAGMPQDLHESGPQPAAQKVAITTPSPPESLVGGSSSYDSTETSEEVVQRSLISAEILSNGIPSRTAMKSLSSAGVLSTHSTELKSSHELHDNRGVEQGVGLSLNRSVEVNSGRMPQGLAELKSPTDLCAKSAEQDVWESLKYPLVLPDWMPLDSAQPGPKMALHTEAAMQDAGESLALQEVVDGRWSDLCLPEANFHTLLYLLCAAGAIHAIQAERCASCIYAGKRGVRFKDCLTAIRAIADEYLVRLSQVSLPPSPPASPCLKTPMYAPRRAQPLGWWCLRSSTMRAKTT